jgi:hypothetical protein
LVALRAGEKITWNAPAMKCVNSPNADHFLKESYRSGWEISS